jgi:GWxTD domain-containing protein
LSFSACVTVKQEQPVNKNLSSEYNPVSKTLHPIFRVFKFDENTTRLYLKLYADELNFNNSAKETENKAVLKIHYDILTSYHSNIVVDSASVSVDFKKKGNENSLFAYLDIKNIKEPKFIIQISLIDQYSGNKCISFVDVDFSQTDGFQNYMSFYKVNNSPIFLGWLRTKQQVLIENSVSKPTLNVKYYKSDFMPAAPPQTSVGESHGALKPDSVWQIPFGGKAVFASNRVGIYRFQTDTTINQGYALIDFGKNFPIFQYSQQMLEALKYLLSTDEYQQMTSAPNKKLELDNFWLKAGGTEDKARELIRIWYSRATYANYYFSSYTEGWKTDRGMIYMVFGPPQTVNKTDGAERWIYSNRTGKILNFIFVKKQNPVSDNYFVLQRDLSYRNYWYNAVDSWRSGTIYQYQ